MNKIVLKAILNPKFPFKENIRQQISNIAHQCPASGGVAVYTARGWYDYITPGNQNDYTKVDDCYEDAKMKLSDNFDSVIRANEKSKV